MKHERVAEIMIETNGRLRKLREAGAKEYSRSDDALANFKRIGQWLGLDPKKVLLVYMFKHLDGVVAYVDGHQSQREGVEGRLDDVEVYIALLRGFIEEERGAVST